MTAGAGRFDAGDVSDRVRDRFTFVVGKGGVGKSTTASAIARGLAGSGRSTHLISTDPAHSLGDLFELDLSDGLPLSAPGHPRLILEELDVRRGARSWVEELAPGVAELVELGTYLDGERVLELAELAFPGVDEVMGALRLVELAEDGPERIVVDTAPTGHMLRLLQVGRLLDGWGEALEAMAERAGAVQERLARRRIRLRGEDALDRVRRVAEQLEDRVLADAGFVVVTRPEPLVDAETDRLLRRLREDGRSVIATVRVSSPAVPPSEPARSEGAGAAADLPALLDRELLLFAGKGGVGKSTCAAACGLALAESGRVLLLGTDPADSLGDLLGTARPPGVRVLWIDPEREFADFRRRYRDEVREVFERLGLEESAPLDRRVMEALPGLAPPGIDEMFALHVMMREAARGETLIVDAAPTGHFLRLIEMPHVALAWTRAVMRIVLDYRAVLGLGQVAERLLELARELHDLIELLSDPVRTGAVVVTLDEPAVRSETTRLVRALEDGGIPIAFILVNRHSSGRVVEGGASGTTERAAGVPRVVAPALPKGPGDPAALRDFFSAWRVAS